ncbi:PH domain-containing protein [Candidatus Aerophobetes bacterium]|nr:PH domain-containing protein [Candidatus Aerophobetes bacterium]
MSEEKVLLRIRPSWRSYLGIFIWAGIFFVLTTSIFVPLQLSMFFQVIIAWYVITGIWEKISLKYTVTENRIIKTGGLILKKNYEIALSDISLVKIKQTTLQRILNIADLEVVIKGGLSYSPVGIKMKGIRKANKIKEIIEKYRREMRKGGEKNEIGAGDL